MFSKIGLIAVGTGAVIAGVYAFYKWKSNAVNLGEEEDDQPAPPLVNDLVDQGIEPECHHTSQEVNPECHYAIVPVSVPLFSAGVCSHCPHNSCLGARPKMRRPLITTTDKKTKKESKISQLAQVPSVGHHSVLDDHFPCLVAKPTMNPEKQARDERRGMYEQQQMAASYEIPPKSQEVKLKNGREKYRSSSAKSKIIMNISLGSRFRGY